MANYDATARSNYVKLSNPEAAIRIAKAAGIRVSKSNLHPDLYCFLSENEGGWPSTLCDIDNTGEETDFSFEENIMPYVEEGEVLVLMEAGAEKLRYIIGAAVAMQRKGEKVSVCQVHLDGIYKIAAKKFKVAEDSITTATY